MNKIRNQLTYHLRCLGYEMQSLRDSVCKFMNI